VLCITATCVLYVSLTSENTRKGMVFGLESTASMGESETHSSRRKKLAIHLKSVQFKKATSNVGFSDFFCSVARLQERFNI
jgi:hypothetical protein